MSVKFGTHIIKPLLSVQTCWSRKHSREGRKRKKMVGEGSERWYIY